MKSIKQTITALLGDSPGIVHINRKERTPMSDDRFSLVVKSTTKIAVAVTGTILVLNAGIAKLVVLSGFGIFFALIYFGLKD